jgi:opacity protein-like surface antigen
MKNNSGLDNHIRSKLSGYTPDVPPHIWENIAAKKGKRRPTGFWWWLMGRNGLLTLAGILMLSAGIWINRTHLFPEKDGTKSTEIITPAIKDQSVQQTINTSTPKTRDLSLTNKNIVTKESKSPAGNTSLISSEDLAAVEQQPTRSPNTKGADAKKQVKSFQQQAKTTAKITPAETEAEEQEDVLQEETSEKLLQPHLLYVALLTSRTNNLTIKSISIPCLSDPCPGSEKSASRGQRYVEVYGGPDYAFRSMSDTGNSLYLEKRKESTKFTSAFSVGVRYTKVFNNGMSFRTGINYSQINEKFKYSQGNIIQVVYITNSNGDTTGSFSTSGTRYKTTHNKYRTLDIPLLIGYEMGNERLRVNVNAGPMINLYSWQRGDLLDTSFQPVNISTGKPSSPYQFKTNAGIGFLASASVYYRLNNRLHFLAEPYFRYNFSPASKSDLTLRQKYNTAGLRLGLRYDF